MAETSPAASGLARTDFHAAIRRNAWNTIWLCLLLVLVGLALGYAVGWVVEVYLLPPVDSGAGLTDTTNVSFRPTLKR